MLLEIPEEKTYSFQVFYSAKSAHAVLRRQDFRTGVPGSTTGTTEFSPTISTNANGLGRVLTLTNLCNISASDAYGFVTFNSQNLLDGFEANTTRITFSLPAGTHATTDNIVLPDKFQIGEVITPGGGFDPTNVVDNNLVTITIEVILDEGPDFSTDDLQVSFLGETIRNDETNSPISINGDTIRVTGLTNQEDTTPVTTGTFTIARRNYAFSTPIGNSITFDDPTGQTNSMISMMNAVEILPAGSTTPDVYGLELVFDGEPVTNLITASSFVVTFGSGNDLQIGSVLPIDDPETFTVTNIFVSPSSSETGTVTVSVPAGYTAAATPASFGRTDTTVTVTVEETGTSNSVTYNLNLALTSTTLPLQFADLSATFNGDPAQQSNLVITSKQPNVKGH